MANYTKSEIQDFKNVAKKLLAHQAANGGIQIITPEQLDKADDSTLIMMANMYLSPESVQKAKKAKDDGIITPGEFTKIVSFALREGKIDQGLANSLMAPPPLIKPSSVPLSEPATQAEPASSVTTGRPGFAQSLKDDLHPEIKQQELAKEQAAALAAQQQQTRSPYLHQQQDNTNNNNTTTNPPAPKNTTAPATDDDGKGKELLNKMEKHPVLAGMGLGLAAVAAKAMTGKASFGDIFVFMLIGALAGFVFDKFNKNISADGKYTPSYAHEDRGCSPRDLPPSSYYPAHNHGPHVNIRMNGPVVLPTNFLGGFRGGHGHGHGC